MDCFIFILEFFGGLILLFVIGGLIGHLLKLDKYYDDLQKSNNKQNK
jgi:hypothetical protein